CRCRRLFYWHIRGRRRSVYRGTDHRTTGAQVAFAAPHLRKRNRPRIRVVFAARPRSNPAEPIFTGSAITYLFCGRTDWSTKRPFAHVVRDRRGGLDATAGWSERAFRRRGSGKGSGSIAARGSGLRGHSGSEQAAAARAETTPPRFFLPHDSLGVLARMGGLPAACSVSSISGVQAPFSDSVHG